MKKIKFTVCKQCNEEFPVKKRKGIDQIFCDRDCFISWKQSHRVVHSRKCKQCQKEFTPVGEKRDRPQKFCCPQHWKDWLADNPTETVWGAYKRWKKPYQRAREMTASEYNSGRVRPKMPKPKGPYIIIEKFNRCHFGG